MNLFYILTVHFSPFSFVIGNYLKQQVTSSDHQSSIRLTRLNRVVWIPTQVSRPDSLRERSRMRTECYTCSFFLYRCKNEHRYDSRVTHLCPIFFRIRLQEFPPDFIVNVRHRDKNSFNIIQVWSNN